MTPNCDPPLTAAQRDERDTMTQHMLLQRAQRAWNDGEREEALVSLLDYAEGRAEARIEGDDDSEEIFEALFADVMLAETAATQKVGAR